MNIMKLGFGPLQEVIAQICVRPAFTHVNFANDVVANISIQFCRKLQKMYEYHVFLKCTPLGYKNPLMLCN